MTFPNLNWGLLAPEVALLVTSVVLLALTLVLRDHRDPVLIWLAGVGLVAAGVFDVLLWSRPGASFGGAMVTDHFAVVLDAVVLLSALVALLLAPREVETGVDYLVLILWAATGMMVLAGALDLMVVFLGLEILSLPLYILSSFRRRSLLSAEAGTKYLLLGAFSSGIFLYGLALLYGSVGTTDMIRIGVYFLGHFATIPLLVKVAVALILVGLGFKLGLVPFHMWVPDVYEGAPTPVTTFMSVGTKVAAFAALARLLLVALPETTYAWRLALWFLAILTMVGGALLMLSQTNMKRLLAYSGVVNAGYLVAVLSMASGQAVASALYFLIAYGVMNLGAFAVVAALSSGEGREEGADLVAYRGLFRRRPWLAVAMTVFLLSLASIPPTGGFLGKVFVLEAILAGNGAVLALAVVFATMVSLYAYLRPIAAMFRPLTAGEAATAVPATPAGVQVALVVLFLATLALGLVPGVLTPILHYTTGTIAGF